MIKSKARWTCITSVCSAAIQMHYLLLLHYICTCIIIVVPRNVTTASYKRTSAALNTGGTVSASEAACHPSHHPLPILR